MRQNNYILTIKSSARKDAAFISLASAKHKFWDDLVVIGVILKPFVVKLFVRPAVLLPKNLGFLELKFPEPDGLKKVLVTKMEEKDSYGTKIQVGVRLKVFLNAESAKEAIKEAKGLTDGIVSFMTLITGRGMDIPREEIAYEVTRNVKEREFLQVFYDVSLESLSRRKLDPKILISFIDKYTRLSSSDAEHLSRAIRWYRLGAMVADVFDQFNCFWIGLEALNPILQQKLKIGNDPIICPKCKHRWVAIPTVSGIREFIQGKLGDKTSLHRNIRKLRNGIMHSSKRLLDLQPLASRYAPETGEVLFRAICYLLGFEEWKTMTHDAMFRDLPMRGELKGSLIGGDPSSLGPEGEDPYLVVHHEIIKSETKEDGSFSYKGQTSFRPHLNPNVKFSPHEIRFYGDSDVTGEITRKTLRKANGKEIPI